MEKTLAYKNLNNGKWSMKRGSPARIVGYAESLVLRNRQFVVQPGERNRARRERQRNVHAWVKGFATDEMIEGLPEDARRVRYNPFEADTFIDAETSEPIFFADVVYLTQDGQCYAVGVRRDSEV